MISILMPIYNAGEYLYKSIGSIQAQTVQDFEIICVDDGSTDNTLTILEALAREDSRIKVISREEKGYAVTMNEALDNATGEYVLNVDPDDWIEPNMLERMLNEIEDCDFVKCAFVFELPDGKQEEYYYTDEAIEFCPRKLPVELKMRFFSSQIAIWTCLIRRSFIEEHNIRLNPTKGAAYQDTAFIWQINSCADKIRVIPDVLYHYNKTNANASTFSSRYPMAPSVEYNFMADWCEKHPEYGMYVRSVLCKCRYISYLWNMKRIEDADRLEFAQLASRDFESDWSWFDTRMFSEQDYNIWTVARTNAEKFVSLFNSMMERVNKEKLRARNDNG